MSELFDVFQPHLKRGSAHLPFDPKKAYAYVEHPQEGWRVYLRACTFLHRASEPFSKQHFLVVKKWKARRTSSVWEPPKGQMEGKDMNPRTPIIHLLKENAMRETEEEAHIHPIQNLHHTGLVFQSQESDYPPNHYFQYHVFQGFVSDEELEKAEETFAWMKAHPKAVQRWKRDRKEKDEIAWFSPSQTRLNPRWCPDMVALYIRHLDR